VVVDVGTGDGRYVVRTAAAGDGTTLAIGIDANADGMKDGVRRARRAKLDNALFVVAAAEALPVELTTVADLVTVHFPWGSLLRGLVAGDTGIVGGIAQLVAPHGDLAMAASVVPSDHVPGLERLDEASAHDIAQRIAGCGTLRTVECRPATAQDLRATQSTWGKRLLHGNQANQERRQVWLWRFRRQAP